MNYATLLIAPDLAELNLSRGREEIENILSSGLQVTSKIGRITATDLVRYITDDRYFVVWLITHGTTDGFYLSDGLYPYTRFAALVRHKVRLIVLNSCDGLEAARSIQNETDASVVAATKTIEDAEGYHFGTLFSRNLASFQTISAAYHASIPANNDSYIYLASELSEIGIGMDWQALYTELAKLSESIHGLRTEIALLKSQQLVSSGRMVDVERMLAHLEEIVTSLQQEDFRINLELRAISQKALENQMTRQQYQFLIFFLALLFIAIVADVGYGAWHLLQLVDALQNIQDR